MQSLLNWLAKSLEDSGQPSSLRLLVVGGGTAVILPVVCVWAYLSLTLHAPQEIPMGASVFFGGALTALLGAKVIQQKSE